VNEKTLVPIANGALIKAEPRERAFSRAVAKLEKRYGRTLIGASYWNQPEELIDKLPPDMRRAARAAQLNKKEAPVGLFLAHEYLTIKARMDAIRDSKGQNLSIQIAGNAVVQLPERLPPPRDDEVLVIEADEVNE
jgi:hypothetical protein